MRLWDLRAGKLLTELGSAGGGPIYDVEFHPHEFLLAGGSQDRTVHFWDLEKFAPIGAAASEDNPAASSSPATGGFHIRAGRSVKFPRQRVNRERGRGNDCPGLEGKNDNLPMR